MTFSVVVADDDDDVRGLIEVAVRRAGLTLEASVADGAAALAAITEHRPDLAILDIAMPEMTGLEVAAFVRETFDHDVRILVLSASVDDAARAVALDAGADHFMAKPFSPRELAAWLAVGKEPR